MNDKNTDSGGVEMQKTFIDRGGNERPVSAFDVFTDAQGRCYVAGEEVPKNVYERFQQLLDEIEELKVRSIGERNPGIDLDEVRRHRKETGQAT